jgi:hypothetical protein
MVVEESDIWPPPPNNQMPPPKSPRRKGWWIGVMQIMGGLVVGFFCDPLFLTVARDACVRSGAIPLLDDFDPMYGNEPLQRALIWSCFFGLSIVFALFLRLSGWKRFAVTALVAHLVVGGLYSFIAIHFMDMW